MFILAKRIHSPHELQQSKYLIEENFDQSIKNEFVFSEAFVEKTDETNRLYIIVKTIPLLRRSFSTKYRIKICETNNGSDVDVKSTTILLRLFLVSIILCAMYSIISESFFLSYYFDFAVILLIVGIKISMSILERNKIMAVIEKLLKI